MGYCTDYSLDHDNHTLDNEELAKELSEISSYSFDEDLMIYDAKWYDWAKDMRTLSKNHIGTLFTLTGEGEESGDIWKAYCRSGKIQVVKAKIVFDDFDEKEMK